MTNKRFSKSIVSDKKIQFIVDFWKRLNQRIETHLKWSFVNHFEIDDQIENVNEILKQYLRVFCNYEQNNWIDLLFFAEFEANFVFNSFTIVVSFLVIKDYIFRFELKASKFIENNSSIKREMKNVDVFVKKIEDFQKYFHFELIWAQVKQIKQINARRHFAFELRINDKIMLNFRFITTMRLNKFLNHKNLEFYIINKIINNVVYQLNLFESMKSIFSVFHSWLLYLNTSNLLFKQHQLNFSSIIIKKESEWKLKKRIDFKLNYKKRNSVINKKEKLQYRVRYKDWNIWNQSFKWQNFEKLENAVDAIVNFHYFHSKKTEFHSTYKRSADWTSSNDN